MKSYRLEVPATKKNFDEDGYLAANPDVAEAVRNGQFRSARQHFKKFGEREGRRVFVGATEDFVRAKRAKLARIEPLLRSDMSRRDDPERFDFLTDELRAELGMDDSSAESSHEYDQIVLDLFERHADGLVLDVGAGRRPAYFEHVVNFEIYPFLTTDVRGVAEDLPFVDESFDAVVSIAVLEHVRDPFRAAAEIVRVLKPGGELFCCVPFLQPLHGYPHHYYNMTHEGLRNLFDGPLEIERVDTLETTSPIWSLTWILRSWADGLAGKAREEFMDLRVADLIGDPPDYLDRPWVRELPREKNLELASACIVCARKPGG